MKNNIIQITTAMMSNDNSTLNYKNLILLNDTMDGGSNVKSYEGQPVKLMFASIIICIDAEIDMRINLKDIHLTNGEMLYIPDGSILDKMQSHEHAKIITICISDSEHRYMPISNSAARMHHIHSHDLIPLKLGKKLSLRMIEIYNMLRHCIEDNSLAHHADDAIKGCMQTFAAYATSAFEGQNDAHSTIRQSRSNQLFKEFMYLVNEHYAEHREVAYYADKLCITPKYLGSVVKNVSGRRPLDWISDLTILDAKAMVVSGSYTVQQVSDKLNFPNVSFFIKYFKKAVGCTPKQYACSKTKGIES